jgi:dolichyl-phosphate-mannose--protein O-mannosyl transferase
MLTVLSWVFQLPTLYFAVIMLSHVLDHFIFSSRRYTNETKAIVFGILSSTILFTFWWFKDVAFGITGPIDDHRGLGWRKARLSRPLIFLVWTNNWILQSWNIYN